ncbi:GNAT family N-acetyltransferase [Paenibacillus eucommiae]|uniref:GNAT superfamily N-acetyltransferase n=1 Tax=Paenibacillus eucommiae TaxID=1355755 RepID=A0ABS4JAZ7_9BACL|nr:GNAT family N-acetyltransferase [Paenibacillus eucommiae]MBP1997022.1 GNAT superfamily N-acetyltransferase [Paenibacillus eucommiae]
MKLRYIETEDCGAILEVASDWWGSNYSSDMFSKWFINHFRETCLLAEENGKMIGFIMGFLSQTKPDEAYIRIVMVDPAWRGKGVGRALYEKFFKNTEVLGRNTIRCVTAPRKKDSITFHARLGFSIEPQEQEIDGIPTCLNYDGRGGNRVVFKKLLHN